MKSKIILLVYFFCQASFGQTETRKSLHGIVINDTIQIENGYVTNKNTNDRTFISTQGFFDILAKPNDTLEIASIAFRRKKIILKELDFTNSIFSISLELFENKLKEVVVDKKKWFEPIKDQKLQDLLDSKKFNDKYSSLKNSTMPQYSIENGADFGRMLTDGVKLFRKLFGVETKPKTKPILVIPEADFIKKMHDKVTDKTFMATLKIDEKDIDLFLIYCFDDPKAQQIINQNDDFLLLDFLITKNKEFKTITTFEK